METSDYYEIEISKYLEKNKDFKEFFSRYSFDPFEKYLNLLLATNEFYLKNKAIIKTERNRIGNNLNKILASNIPTNYNQVISYFFKKLYEALQEKQSKLISIYNLDYIIDELLESKSIIILNDINNIILAKLVFEEEDFIHLLIQDLANSSKQDTSRIKKDLKYSTLKLSEIFNRNYIYRTTRELKFKKLEGYNHEMIFERTDLGPSSLKIEEQIGKSYSEKTVNEIIKNIKIKNEELVLTNKERLTINKKYRLKQLIFLIRLTLKQSDIDIFSETIITKITHTCKYSISSKDSFEYMSELKPDLLINFLSKETLDKLIDLFIILTIDFNFFNQHKGEKTKINEDALCRYFDYYFKKKNKAVGASHTSVQSKIKKKKGISSLLYDQIGISPNTMKRILRNPEVCNEVYLKNKLRQ